MADVTERLRDVRCDREPFSPEHAQCICRLANEAAKEIENLREQIETIRGVNSTLQNVGLAQMNQINRLLAQQIAK